MESLSNISSTRGVGSELSTFESLEAALRIEDLRESVHLVKSIAAETLTDADKEVRVVPTQNFNHTYLPDFVLEWPTLGRRENRFVYLRATSDPVELQEDLIELQGRQPIFVHLSRLAAERSAGDSNSSEAPASKVVELKRTATESQSLVTTLPAIDRFQRSGSVQTGKIVSSYVVRGGQGLLEDNTAIDAASRIERGFQGALEADPARTLEAISAIGEILDVSSATEFTHLLEAAWISSGASAMDFPGAVSSLGEKISPPLLKQLLDIGPELDEDFWERLGSAVDLTSIEGLHLVGDQPKLQLLMSTALKNLSARKCVILAKDDKGARSPDFAWQIDSGKLSLASAGHQAWIFNTGGISARQGMGVEDEPTITKLSTRSQNSEIPIVQLDASNGNRRVTYASESNSDITSDDALTDIGATLGTSATVNEAVALAGGSKPLKLDFGKGSATGRTNASFYVQDLLWSAWSLLAETEEEERSNLRDALNLDSE